MVVELVDPRLAVVVEDQNGRDHPEDEGTGKSQIKEKILKIVEKFDNLLMFSLYDSKCYSSKQLSDAG